MPFARTLGSQASGLRASRGNVAPGSRRLAASTTAAGGFASIVDMVLAEITIDTGWGILIGFALATIGALVGSWLKTREFRRDHRLTVYGDVLGGFKALGQTGASMYRLAVFHGDSLHGEKQGLLEPLIAQWNEAAQRFDEASGRLSLIGSKKARASVDQLEIFLTENIRRIPPFVRMDEGKIEWGKYASVGPAKVSEQVNVEADNFAKAVRPELTAWRKH